MVFRYLCMLVVWTKVASALEGFQLVKFLNKHLCAIDMRFINKYNYDVDFSSERNQHSGLQDGHNWQVLIEHGQT